jgi:2-polyprenyl-3-methyl-5-hydroxy-6-metoxy-1,4-benzoquinol methylase
MSAATPATISATTPVTPVRGDGGMDVTLVTMQEHEKVTLKHGVRDFRRKSLNELVRSRVQGRSVLDLRCLSGHLSVSLAQKGFAVTALDAYPGAVQMTNARAREHGLPDIAEEWDLTRLAERMGDARFDTILCVDVLNHVADDAATLADATKLLAPDGRIVLAVPALHRLLGARDRKLGHLRRYSKPQLIALLEGAGLRAVEVRHWNLLALPFQFLWEGVLRRELKDKARYGPENAIGAFGNRVLGVWYVRVENRIRPPVGVSLFAVAERG